MINIIKCSDGSVIVRILNSKKQELKRFAFESIQKADGFCLGWIEAQSNVNEWIEAKEQELKI